MEGTIIFYLGLDYIKGTLTDECGNIILSEQRELRLRMDEEYAEQEPEQWYTSIIDIIRSMQSSVTDFKITAMTITYQPGTYVCVDRYGKPLMNAILPCDRRAKYQIHLCEKIIKGHGNGYFIPWNLMILPRLLWIKFNKTDVYRRIFKVLTPDGYIAYRMSGESAIDSYSALLMGYNNEYGSYDSRLIEALELDRGIFPSVIKTGECIGMVAGEARDMIGLNCDAKIFMLSSSLLPLAVITRNEGKGMPVYDSESSFLCFINGDSRIKGDKEITRINYHGNDYYFLQGNYEMHFMKCIKKLFGCQNSITENYSAGSNGLVVLPYIMGNNRLYGSDIKGTIIGIGDNTASDVLTATYEALGYTMKERFDELHEYGLKAEELEMLYQPDDKLFPQIVSNIISRKVMTKNFNDIYNSAVFCILNNSEKLLNIEVSTYMPDEGESFKYRHLYNLYKSTSDSLSGIYRYRRKIMRRISI